MKQTKLSFGKPTSAKKSNKDETQEQKVVDPLLFFKKKVEQKPGIVLKKSNYFNDKDVDTVLMEKADEIEKSLDLEPMDVSDENNPISNVESKEEIKQQRQPEERIKETPKVEETQTVKEKETGPVKEQIEEEPKKKFNYYAHKAKLSQLPKAHGSKEIPVGQENCLGGLAFVFTGELESLSRDEAIDLVKRYGG